MTLSDPTDTIHTSVSCVAVFMCVCVYESVTMCLHVSVSVYVSVCVHARTFAACLSMRLCFSVWMCVYKCMYDVERQLCFQHTSVQGQSPMDGSMLAHESRAEAEEKPSSPPFSGFWSCCLHDYLVLMVKRCSGLLQQTGFARVLLSLGVWQSSKGAPSSFYGNCCSW